MDIDELVSNLEFIDDWEERYRYVIELGRDLPGLEDALKTEENRVKGCASQVWLVMQQKDGKLWFEGDSDAHIVRGLVAIVLAYYSGLTPAEIIERDALAFFRKLGFEQALSPQRSNGLRAMVERIRRDATLAA